MLKAEGGKLTLGPFVDTLETAGEWDWQDRGLSESPQENILSG